MVSEIVTWIEAHPATVSILNSAALIGVAWFAGAFSFLRRFRLKPRLEIAPTASFAYLERPKDQVDRGDCVRMAFVLNATLVNASNERVVLDHFLLSFRTEGFWRSNRQKLLRLAFPARPRKPVGEGEKYMGVWFTEYLDEGRPAPPIDGELEPKSLCGGYLLFVSYTYGNWNPEVWRGVTRIRLKAKLTSQRWLSCSADVRVIEDADYVESFVPGLLKHIAHDSTWNHDLSVGSIPR